MHVHAIQAVSEPNATLPSRNYFATNGQVMSLQEHEAWLEHAGEQRRLESNCSIGRAGLNTIIDLAALGNIFHLEARNVFLSGDRARVHDFYRERVVLVDEEQKSKLLKSGLPLPIS